MSEAKHNEGSGVPRARATVPFTHETAEHIRLIAAAPELLAFIEEIVGDLEGLSHEQKALDLIAKAKGKAE